MMRLHGLANDTEVVGDMMKVSSIAVALECGRKQYILEQTLIASIERMSYSRWMFSQDRDLLKAA